MSAGVPGGLVIRGARAGEADTLTALALRSKAYRGYSPEFMAACRDELRVSADDIRTGAVRYAVSEKNTRVVGYYGKAAAGNGQFELEALFVEPAHIGTGVGRALIRHALHEVAVRKGRVLVIQGDPNAERFYRAAGGEYAGRRESLSIPGRFLPVFRINVPVIRRETG